MKSYLSVRKNANEKMGIYAVTALTLSFLFLMLFYNSWVISLLGSLVITLAGHRFFIKEMRKKELRWHQRQFLEFLQILTASIESGRSMEEGMEESIKNLKRRYQKDSGFVISMDRICWNMKNSREKDILLLEELAKESSLEDLKDFVQAYSICRQTGGDLEQAISLTCQVITDKMKLQQELRVLSAQKRMEARLISLMPLLILLFLKVTAPDYIAPLYDTMMGRLIMTLAMGAMALAYYLTDRIMEVRV